MTPASANERFDAGRDFALLMALFLAFRLLGVVFLRPGGLVYVGGHDFNHYMELAEYSLQGQLPYLHYWSEYPPLFPFVLVALYQLSLALPTWTEPLLWFQVLVSGLLALCEAGNLILVFAIARRLHGDQVGLRAAWLYALLFFPFYTLTNWFDAWPLTFLLLSLYLGLRHRPALSGLAVGLGFLTKLIPAVAGPALLLYFAGWRERALLVGTAAVVALGVVVPLYLANPTMFRASLEAMLGRPTWLTPWAMLEGYYGVGYMPGPESRFDPQAAAWQSHPTVLPLFLLTVALGAALLWFFTRRLDWRQPRVLIASTALALNLLILLNKGWSPQFTLYPLALLIVLLPNGTGVAYALALTALAFLEWPIAGQLFERLRWLLAAVIVLRTVLLLALSTEYATLLWPQLRKRWVALRNPAAALGLAALLVLGGLAVPRLTADFARGSELYPVAAYVRALGLPQPLVVASSRRAYYAIRPLLPGMQGYPPGDELWQNEKRLAEQLRAVSANSSEAWLVLDHSAGAPKLEGMAISWFDRWGSRATDTWVGAFHVLGYSAFGTDGGPAVTAQAQFGDELSLDGWSPPSGELAAEQPLRVTLYWRTLRLPNADYKVFLHLLDGEGKIAAQADRPLGGPRGTATAWQAGEASRDAYDLHLPTELKEGAYKLVVGLYEPKSGKRLPLTPPANGDAFTLPGWSPRWSPVP